MRLAAYPGDMARSPLTLAASVSAALPGEEAIRVQTLTTNSSGRNESAMVTLADGRAVVVRIPIEESTASELATEAIALRALTDGARALAGFAIPEFLGSVATPPQRAFITTFVPGYQVDTAHIPAGPGVAYSLGSTLAQVHALPASIVRNAGLPSRTAYEVRDDLQKIVEESSATGRVPVRLMVRWRDALKDDALWQFQPTVTLGGADALAFVYHDVDEVPTVSGVIDWHGLSIGDPAVDLQFLQTAPEAAESVLDAYRARALRSGDEYLRARARLHAELEFARWLLHGRDTHDESIMDDAGAMLDTLAENVRDEDLMPQDDKIALDDALAAMSNLPSQHPAGDTSMHTDTYDPEELALSGVSLSDVDTNVDPARDSRIRAAAADTQALSREELLELNTQRGAAGGTSDAGAEAPAHNEAGAAADLPFGLEPLDDDDDPNATQPLSAEALAVITNDQEEAARAARAAIDRWKTGPV